MALSSGSP